MHSTNQSVGGTCWCLGSPVASIKILETGTSRPSQKWITCSEVHPLTKISVAGAFPEWQPPMECSWKLRISTKTFPTGSCLLSPISAICFSELGALIKICALGETTFQAPQTQPVGNMLYLKQPVVLGLPAAIRIWLQVLQVASVPCVSSLNKNHKLSTIFVFPDLLVVKKMCVPLESGKRVWRKKTQDLGTLSEYLDDYTSLKQLM